MYWQATTTASPVGTMAAPVGPRRRSLATRAAGWASFSPTSTAVVLRCRNRATSATGAGRVDRLIVLNSTRSSKAHRPSSTNRQRALAEPFLTETPVSALPGRRAPAAVHSTPMHTVGMALDLRGLSHPTPRVPRQIPHTEGNIGQVSARKRIPAASVAKPPDRRRSSRQELTPPKLFLPSPFWPEFENYRLAEIIVPSPFCCESDVLCDRS